MTEICYICNRGENAVKTATNEDKPFRKIELKNRELFVCVGCEKIIRELIKLEKNTDDSFCSSRTF